MTDETGERSFVLDASALLCLLFREPGADQVEARMTRSLVSVVNYHEVLAKLSDRGVEPAEARGMLAELDVEIVDVDREQADLGGALRPLTRNAGLSLGDRSCLALAQSRKAIAVTTDRAWKTLELGIDIEAAR